MGVAIRKIRDVLGDNAEAPCYVETVPRRGYRFLAPVTTEAERPPLSSLGAEKRSAISRRYIAIAAFLVLAICGIAYRFRLPRTRTENKISAETDRKTQADFACLSCGYQDNADHNAAVNISARNEPLDANVSGVTLCVV